MQFTASLDKLISSENDAETQEWVFKFR